MEPSSSRATSSGTHVLSQGWRHPGPLCLLGTEGKTKGKKEKAVLFCLETYIQLEPTCFSSSRETVLPPHVSTGSPGEGGPPGG